MRTSRREFVKWVTASGIALSLSRLASAAEPTFAARETLPGRQGWNPAANGAGRIDGVAKVTRAKPYASDQARLKIRDGGFVKFAEETGAVVLPDYGAHRFTRVAGPTPEAPDVYSPVLAGWVSPGKFQNSERRIWTPLAIETGTAYAKAAS